MGTDPPHGYTLPKAAADLVKHAIAHGWRTRIAWEKDSGGAPFVTVALGRLLTESELPLWRGNRWEYRITWHSRGLPQGRMRLFNGWEVTPGEPAPHDLPSVKKIREIVSNHPA